MAQTLVILAMVWSLSGCAVQRRERLPAATLSPSYRTATLQELDDQLRHYQQAIQTLNATVDLQPSVTSIARGELIQYRDVRAFILIRRPVSLRMIGQAPVVRNTAFDMSYDGSRFSLYIPSKNRFIIGNSHGGKRSETALENIRPQHLLDALLWEPPGAQEQSVLEVVDQIGKSFYVIHILRQSSEGKLSLSRKLWFERQDLRLARLQIFDERGVAVTEAQYSNYKDFSGISFPQRIALDRPRDNYGLELTILKVDWNQPLGDDKFLLEQPQGTELIDMETNSQEQEVANGG